MKDRAEGEDITVVMRDLQKTIERELDQPGSFQLEVPGCSDSERDQRKANMDALRRRLPQIPGELAAIVERYAEPPLFPVAVTFLVPERLPD